MSNELLQELVGDKKSKVDSSKRKIKAINDFGYFCDYYLADYFFVDPADYHIDLYDIANTQSLSKKTANKLKKYLHEKYHNLLVPESKLAGAIFLEPREHGKSVRWSFAYALWCALSGKKKYILLIGAAGTAASDNLINIRTELEENERILEDFGDLKGKVWRDDRIEFSLGACIQAKGSGASMRGTRYKQHRPDLIILDDLLKDEQIESPTQRSKIYKWIKRVVFNLGKKAFIVWVNTIFHSDDPPSRLLKEIEEETLKRWIAVRLSCYLPNGKPLWPQLWSKQDLEEKSSQLGSDIFSTEWENEPLSDEERIIKPEWIEAHWYINTESSFYDSLRYFAGVDPATGKHDRTSIVSLGVDSKGIMWEVDTWAKVCSETETVEQLIIKHQKYNYELIGWEEVVFSGIYANYVMKLAAEKNIYLPIEKIKIGNTPKIARIRSMSPLVENGIIRIREKGAKELINELTTFPKGKFDDTCDALDLARKIVSSGSAIPQGFLLGKKSKLSQALKRFKNVR